MPNRFYSIRRTAVLALAALFLTACNALINGPVYDADIEAGLNQYHRDTTAFITSTVALGPAGAYDRDESREFYARSSGLLNNLAVRAQASDPQGTCAPSKLVSSGLGGVISSFGELDDVGPEATSELSSGSCLTISLKAVIVSHGALEELHKHRNALRAVTAKIAQGRIDQTVRLALIQVRAAKP